jgi:hypothetical protein
LRILTSDNKRLSPKSPRKPKDFIRTLADRNL